MTNSHLITRLIILIVVILTISSAQTSTAVINFVSINISKSEADTVTDVLRAELSNIGSFQVLKLDKMEQILEQQGFDQAGCIARRCLVDVGILLEVPQVLGGRISKKGDVLVISSRLVDIKTGELVKSLTYE
jgi:TolB-like protein